MDESNHVANVGDSPEEQPNPPHSLQSRAYQLEMLEQSLQQNIIVAMDTGSGKTQIAKLRIEAELERSPDKRIWFCAPSVVLARQQHCFLSSQLPAYQIRLITGLDNAQFWSTQDVWDAVLDKIDVVVSTPQILVDALSHAFVSIQQLSLLVFDEAHHCIGNEAMAFIMTRFYHPLRDGIPISNLPHILGLTASPITNKPSMLSKLEANLNSLCKTPTLQVQDYQQHIYMPAIERISFALPPGSYSPIVAALKSVVAKLTIADDPAVKWLLRKKPTSELAAQKLAKILDKDCTPVMKQMSSFLGHAQHICETLGEWAVDLYVRSCSQRLHEGLVLHESLVPNLADQEQKYMDAKLQSVLRAALVISDQVPSGHLVASKAQAVMDYLSREYRQGVTAIIFVKRRSVAYALSQLLEASPQMKDYGVFSFVGAANAAYRTLVDLADMQLQNEAFADFQAGRRNICVATQVMEEGIDVQATNLVIRFDEPETFRSFVQSRGRARRPNSKFVMVHSAEESSSVRKLRNWNELEQVMKEQCSDLTRVIRKRQEIEEEREEGNEFYRVETTGALLSYDNAQQHLQHFCATLPWEESGEPAQAITIISGDKFDHKSAQIKLPSSVPPSLQTTKGLGMWRTERMARRDAAFQTCKRLHTARLINDNLLPHPRTRKVDEKLEGRESFYEVSGALDPWMILMQTFSECSYVHGHLIRVTGEDFAFSDLVMLLPVQIQFEMSFTLESLSRGPMLVTVKPQDEFKHTASNIDIEVTRHLYMAVLGRRLKQVDPSSRLPYLLVPEAAQSNLPHWLEQAKKSVRLSDLTFNNALQQQKVLLKHQKEEVLYSWTPCFDQAETKQYSPDEVIVAQRLSKQLSYLQDPANTGDNISAPDVRYLVVDDCAVQGLPAAYGSVMLLMPSVSHMISIALRGHLAVQQGPLLQIGFSDGSLVTKALTSSSASSEHNFEALEFIGDSLLKYYASVQVFFEHPELTEGGLTTKYAAIANNARLQRATKELGLEPYITVEGFSGQKWTLSTTEGRSTRRQMSSKTLADVIEALIGAAYLDQKNGPTKDELPLSALSHVLPDIKWKSPHSHVTRFHESGHLLKADIARLEDVENMLGYQFQHRSLLLEALTRTTIRSGSQSFQRLEFLGDAILDRIVNVTLYNSKFGQDPEHLKYRRDALVNRWILAFLAMEACHTLTTNQVQTTPSGRTTITTKPITRRLIDHMRTSSTPTEQLQRQTAETTFVSARPDIMTSLSSGNTFPWVSLHSISASKSYSDMIESLLAAVFIDSHASLPTCERILENLGLMKLLSRLTTESDLDVRQPITRLMLTHPNVTWEKKDMGKRKDRSMTWKCSVLLEGKAVASTQSAVSEKHAEAMAAEMALERLAMGDVDVDMGMGLDMDMERNEE